MWMASNFCQITRQFTFYILSQAKCIRLRYAEIIDKVIGSSKSCFEASILNGSLQRQTNDRFVPFLSLCHSRPSVRWWKKNFRYWLNLAVLDGRLRRTSKCITRLEWRAQQQKKPPNERFGIDFIHTNEIKCITRDTLRFQAKWKDVRLFARLFSHFCVFVFRWPPYTFTALIRIIVTIESVAHESIHQFCSVWLLSRPTVCAFPFPHLLACGWRRSVRSSPSCEFRCEQFVSAAAVARYCVWIDR